jgi:hypothetical protein
VSGRDENIYGLIASVVRDETKYLRHYIGKVVENTDTEQKGRIKCTIDELGWDTPALAVKCYPRQLHALTVPLVNEYVEVYFMSGDPSRGMYLAIASEMANMKPSKYTMQTMHVIFEHPKNKQGLIYDESQKKWTFDGDKIDIKINTIVFNDGTEKMALGSELQTQINKLKNQVDTLKNNFTAWTPVAQDGGAALKAIVSAGFCVQALADFTNILSNDIKVK